MRGFMETNPILWEARNVGWLLVIISISGFLGAGCAGPFDPFDGSFTCQEDGDCVRGFRCSADNICVVGDPLPDLYDVSGSDASDASAGDGMESDVAGDTSDVDDSCLDDELCNGEDDDCDGAVDESFAQLGEPCLEDEANPCDDGLWACTEDGSALECVFDAGDWGELCAGAVGFDWTEVISEAASVQPMESYSLTCAQDRAFIFSGAVSSVDVGESKGLFIFSENEDGVWAWAEASADGAPVGRIMAPFEYLPDEEKVLLFGGNGFGPVYGDTWTWSEAEGWVEEAPASAPSARTGHDLVYIPDNKSVLLFGGHPQNCDGDFGDTWTWNNGEWLELSPETSPSARHQHRMTWDAGHGYALMFGGREGCGEFIAETWAFDGEAWHDLTPESSLDSPPVTARGAMTYDPKVGAVVYVTEEAGAAMTWLWSGSKWFRLSPQSNPGVYDDPQMCHLEAAGASVMAGSRDGASATWLWTAPGENEEGE